VEPGTLYLLENRAKDLAEGLFKFETEEEPSKKRLKEHLEASSSRIEAFLEDSAAGTAKRRVFKKGVIPHLGYLIAHESHHRGNILLTLKQCGHNLDQATRYAIWNRDKI
jgi:uncharacterized damage-inducible protein DinB